MKRNPLKYCLLLLLTCFATLCKPVVGASNDASVILILGDSLSAGYGIKHGRAWPDLLQAQLTEGQFDYNVVNLSISGETTDGGLSRLPNALKKYNPEIFILALGANDALRGLPLEEIRDNLKRMIQLARRANAKILLITMRIPLNYGSYADDFYTIYSALAKEEKLPPPPFLLEGIATRPELFQSDSIHPNIDAQPLILDTVWRSLQPLLSKK